MDFNVGRTEAESLARQAYQVFDRDDLSGGRGIEAFLTGNAFGDFEGPSGVYDITVRYLDENDGVGEYALLLNGVIIHEWIGDGGGNGFGTPEDETFRVALATDDVIGIRSTNVDGEFGRIDYIDITPASASDAGGGGGDAVSIGVGLNEAETLTIGGAYTVQNNPAAGNGQVVGTTTTGTVTGAFTGAAGTYDVTVNYLDESDGVGLYQLSLNGSQVGTWQGLGGTSGTGSPASETFTVTLSPGDELQVSGVSVDGEAARIDSIVILGSSGGGSGTATISVGRTEAEDLDLTAAADVESRSDSSGGAVVRSLGDTYTASGEFTGAAGTYEIAVDWLNENDGVSTFQLLINGQVAGSWQGTGGNGPFMAETETFTVALNPNDTIAVRGTQQGGEFARVDSLSLTPVAGVENSAPVVTNAVANQSAVSGIAFSLSLPTDQFFDVDGDALIITASQSSGASLPSWLSFNAGTGTFTGTPGGGDTGTVTVAVTASDGEATASDSFDIIVGTQPSGGNAIITVGSTEAEALDLQNYDIESRNDASGGQSILTFGTGTASGTFSGETGIYDLDVDYFNESDGTATWTVFVNGQSIGSFMGTGGSSGFGTVETETFTVSLASGDVISVVGQNQAGELARLDKITLTASGSSNIPPIVSNPIDNTGGTVGEAFSFVLPSTTFFDADGDPLALTATQANGDPLPDWLSFNALTNVFSGVPGAGDAGLVSVRVTATDGEATASDTFDIAVTSGSGANAFLTVGSTEAESLDLLGYEVETRGDALGGASVRTFDTGTVSGTFSGSSGLYQVDVDFLNESDGVSTWTVFVNGTEQLSFAGDGGTSAVGTADRETFNLLLQGGDEVSITGVRGGDELARLDRITLTSLETNEFPVGTGDTASADEDTAVTLDVLANDTDAEDDSLSVIAVQGQPIAVGQSVAVNGGSVTLNVDQTLTLTPPADFVGAFGFTYTVSDGSGFDIATATVTYTNTNDAPTVATELGSVTLDEDSPLAVSLAGAFTDADANDPLTLTAQLQVGDTLVDLPDWLVFDDTAGAEGLSGTPTGADVGAYTVVVTAQDGVGETVTSSLLINVGVVNDAPVAVDDAFSGAEDTAITVDLTANDTDEENNPLAITEINGTGIFSGESVTINSNVVVGDETVSATADLTLNADGTVTLVATPEFSGPIAFEYTITDGEFTASATATITVTDGNDAPSIASAIANQTASEDTFFDFSVPDGLFGDIDGDVLTLTAFQSNGQPLPAWLSFVDGTFQGTPGPDDAADLQILVLASDGQFVVGSIFTLAVETVDDAPVASDSVASAFTVDEGFSFVIGDQNNPIEDFATDEDSDLDPSRITFTGASVDDIPVADLADIGLTYNPETGALDIATAGIAVFRDLGPDDTADLVVSFEASDGNSTDTGTLTFTVTGVNDAPLAGDDTATIDEGSQTTINVLSNDTDPEGSGLLVSEVAGETVSIGSEVDLGNAIVRVNSNYSLTVTPNANVSGLLTFEYAASDGELSSIGTVSVTINGVNDAPTASDVSLGTLSAGNATIETIGDTLAISDFATDPDSDLGTGNINFLSATIDAGGVLDPDAVGLTYNSATGALEIDPTIVPAFIGLGDGETADVAVTFEVDDGEFFDTASLSFTVSGLNDGPVVPEIPAQTIAEDDQTSALLSSIQSTLGAIADPDGDPVSVQMTFAYPAESGFSDDVVPVGSDGSFNYTPPANFVGDVAVTVRADDGQSLANSVTERTFTLTVENAPDGPVATDDIATTVEDNAVTVAVLANDTDADDDALSVTEINGEAILAEGSVDIGSATVTLNANGTLDVSPVLNRTDPVTFDYTVSDGELTDGGSVTVSITAVNDAPIAIDFTAPGSVDADSAVTLTLGTDFQVNDLVDDPDSTFTAASFTFFGQANGITYNASTGDLTFDPTGNSLLQSLGQGQTAVTSSAFAVSDGQISDIGIATFNVTGVNDAPTLFSSIADQSIAAGSVSIISDATTVFRDVDQGDFLTFTAVDDESDPLPDWIAVDAFTGLLTVTPDADDAGTITVALTATDSLGEQVTDTFDITVTAPQTSPGLSAEDLSGMSAPLDQSVASSDAFSFDGIMGRAMPTEVQVPMSTAPEPASRIPDVDGSAFSAMETDWIFDIAGEFNLLDGMEAL